MRRVLVMLVGVLVVAGAVGVGLAAGGSRVGVGWVARELPGSNPQANAINNKGWVVGSTDSGGCYHPALWVNGRLRDLGTLGGRCSHAEDVNDRGQVVGWSLTRGNDFDSRRAFLWENGRMRDLGIACADANAINERGQIVGGIDGDCAPAGEAGMRAWMWENGKVRWLLPTGVTGAATGINERGQVVGWSQRRSAQTSVFLYQKGRLQRLGVESDYGGAAINDRGQVVSSGEGLLWENGKTIRICAGICVLSAINNRGQVVGCRGFKSVFVWHDGTMAPLSVPQGVTERCASDVNDRGQAVGYSQEGPLEGGVYWAWLWTKTG